MERSDQRQVLLQGGLPQLLQVMEQVRTLPKAQAVLASHSFWKVNRKPSDAGVGQYVLGPNL